MTTRQFLACLASVLICGALYFTLVLPVNSEEKHHFIPEKGFVPDEETAISIAVAVWNPIYGKEKIQEEKPFKASLKDGIWIVEGSLPKGWLGGVAIAEISKKDACILRVSHGQ